MTYFTALVTSNMERPQNFGFHRIFNKELETNEGYGNRIENKIQVTRSASFNLIL